MEEITVDTSDSSSVHVNKKNKPSSSSSLKISVSRSRTVGYVPEPFDSEKVPPTFISDIRPFLRVANQIELEWPRVAYLCRFHAFERAHRMDPSSSGRGARQFKTSLLQRLEQDEEDTVFKRKEKSDLHELKRAYLKYEDYIRKHSEHSDRGEQLMSARGIASVLSEVIRTVASGTGLEIIADAEDVEAKPEFYQSYNILPLDPGGEHQAIMQLPEIKAALEVVQNIRGLPSAENHQKSGAFSDSFDWLQCWFGFQKGNVSNQREHLLLLLANIHIRQGHETTSTSKLGEKALDDLMKKLFRNYKRWCRFLGRKRNIWLPSVKLEEQQYKILYIGLFLLIWGEASNLRFMPECLCYLFHHMAYELHGVLSGAVNPATGELVRPAYGGEPESFLNKVVTPIYWVIYKEAQKNKSGTADHSEWRNYDDLNEYFWSPDCFELGWPIRLDHNFFFVQSSVTNTKESKKNVPILAAQSILEQSQVVHTPPFKESSPLIWKTKIEDSSQVIEDKDNGPKWLGKKNFVEIRSFWQLFRSFDRMWIFFILALQAMIIMAWHDLKSPFQLFDKLVFEDIMSIFITSAVLKLIQVNSYPIHLIVLKNCVLHCIPKMNYTFTALLDLAFTWKVRHTMDFSQIVRYMLKPVAAAIWTIILPVFYADSRRNSRCFVEKSGNWLGEWCITSYMVTVAFYMASNAIGMVLFLVPLVNKYIETSSWRVCTIFSWWAQPRLYVGRGMQENHFALLKYSLFWMLLLLSKLSFSYYYEIKPLVQPTKKIMKIGVSSYDWHQLFPKVKSNAGAIVAVWAPILLVYFMDTQIWYSVFCAVFGGLYGIFRHLGEIRTMGMLRSKFPSLALAFNVFLVPPSSKRNSGSDIRSFFKKKLHKVSENEKNVVAKFAQVWNQIITSFRDEDLISNREMDLMTIPVSIELGSGLIRWPVFLLATKFSIALSMARDFVGKDEKLLKKIRKDNFMYLAVKECYESLKYILQVLVVGELEKRIVSEIINEVEMSISKSSFLMDFRMSELPDLHTKCIDLVDLLVENKEADLDKVVKRLQDIFEVVMQDIMTHGSRLLDMLYGSQPLKRDTGFFKEFQPQLFASFNGKSTILFPLPDSGPLKEQIRRLLLLLTANERAMEVPVNLEARRRISFFATSLFMDMPFAPKVRNMLSFSVLTPHYQEEINFSMRELHSRQEGVSIIFYMQKMYPDEWKNFLERIGCENLEEINIKEKEEDLRKWASFRGQTLSRTVRGMMYYRKAIKLQAFLDMAEDEDIFEDYKLVERRRDRKHGPHSLSAQLDALADMKFTYVVTCQSFGVQKASGDSHAQDLIDLMMRYPSLRVAYVEEKEVIETEKPQKVYSSILVKAVNYLDQEIYRIKLPGPPNIGEGKPENQNHAIIFTRGDALQTIDMNQDNYIEEAFKMRNVLQEFLRHQEQHPPTIIGLREHIFTGRLDPLTCS
ncbi:hypothetical protein IFM89_028447 [Coptis chinensis]|uniref:1,3-beta-glucan synthase n=1 Tax=Coptis chinensis TaxID=261450 RepID=A0A835IQT8_9MAGN|nr:hypothetical protein IFM89_028447 [Coptis chinensis]